MITGSFCKDFGFGLLRKTQHPAWRGFPKSFFSRPKNLIGGVAF